MQLEGVVTADSPYEAFLSQSPYGAKWFATKMRKVLDTILEKASQSPYGAKWFATKLSLEEAKTVLANGVAIPLRG